MALLLLDAGADPLYTCIMEDEQESIPPLLAVMRAIPTGMIPSLTLHDSLLQGSNPLARIIGVKLA